MGKTVLYIECTNGISGDMTLGALIHAGANEVKIEEELKKLNPGEFELKPCFAQKSGILGIDLKVVIPESSHAPSHAHSHTHSHDHSHTTYTSIKNMIENSELNDNVKNMALSIFKVIGIAEAAVHDIPLEEVAFHEVGAVDSIVDIVGTAIAIDLLYVDKVYCSPVHDGQGQIECRHGIIPVPVPAVMEMLKKSEIPIVINSDVTTEMVTPTGFGILEGLHAECKPVVEMMPDFVGYGFGNRETGRFNAVRVIIGEEFDEERHIYLRDRRHLMIKNKYAVEQDNDSEEKQTDNDIEE